MGTSQDSLAGSHPNEAGSGVAVHAGFPNPAAEKQRHGEGSSPGTALDINQLLIQNPTSTFYFTISGHLWEERGIYDGDLTIIDRSLTPRRTDLVLVWLTDGFIIVPARLLTGHRQPWGVITAIIHRYRTKAPVRSH